MTDSAWQISALHAPDLPTAVDIGAEGLTLGRDPSGGVVVPGSAWPGVSAHHARVTVTDDDAVLVEDLDSKNGVLVDGRRVRSARLRHGNVFELGPGGPRFLVLSTSRLDETLVMATPHSGSGLVTSQLDHVRHQLGLPDEGGVDELIRRGHRTQTRRVALVVVLALVAAVALYVLDQRRGDRRLDEQRDAMARQQAQLDATMTALQIQQAELKSALAAVEQQRAGADAARAAWEADREQLRAERRELEDAIDRIEQEGQSAAGELDELRARLDETAGALRMYDPVNLEQAKLHEVSRIEEAVVLFDVVERYRERTTGRLLYTARDDPDQDVITLNFKDRGDVFSSESSGSGFCVSPDGWIVTNAHVVLKKHADPVIDLGPDIALDPEVELAVVFSGGQQRHVARVVDWRADGDLDLALVKIEPFPGMPWVELPPLDAEPPARGAEVFLLGFPLGRAAMQEGDTVIASAFRGIVSRTVGDFLQVDAAVHPGASGGPVIDGQGHVTGVVTGMQALGDGKASSAIGYVIPVRELRGMWPPAP